MVKRSKLLKLIPVFIVYVLIFKFIYRDNGFDLLMDICVPIFSGIFIAIVLNPIIIFLEEKLKIKYRAISIIITYLFFIIIVTLLLFLIIPSIITSISQFFNELPNLIKTVNRYVIESESVFEELGGKNVFISIKNSVQSFTSQISSYSAGMVKTAFTSVVGLVKAIISLVISILISIYVIGDKEYFENLFIRLCHSTLEKKYADEVVNLGYQLYTNVTRFISGMLISSLFVTVVSYVVGEYIIKAPFALILSLLMGVTNVIPYFGPFIGGIPATVIVFLMDPIKGIWMGIMVFAIQQVDGWILAPKILGMKLNIRPVWIIIAITIGGGLFGAPGMFLATPFAALIKTFMDGYMLLKLKEKEIKLPHEEK